MMKIIKSTQKFLFGKEIYFAHPEIDAIVNAGKNKMFSK